MAVRETNYDVIVIGTGPAGMFAAREILAARPHTKILMLEKGPLRELGDRDNKTCGWGGAGAFSDGKLDLTGEIGGNLGAFLSTDTFAKLMRTVETSYVSYCSADETSVETEPDPVSVQRLATTAAQHGMKLIPFPVRHLGTDRSYDIVMGMRRDLLRAGVVILMEHEATAVDPQNDGSFAVRVRALSEEIITPVAKKIVIATGREGDDWLWREAVRLALPVQRNRADIGVRVEVRHEIFAEYTDVLHEPKLIFHSPSHGDRIRTFCVCPRGFVIREQYRGLGVWTVNGQSNSARGAQSPNTNFAILVSQEFTAPFNDPSTYAASIARTTNMLAGGNNVLVQRIADIEHFRRSTESRVQKSSKDHAMVPTLPDAVPGDLTLAIPARHWLGIMEMLKALNQMVPGIAGPHTLLYGAEVKFYSNQILVAPPFETTIPGLYVAGDGSGNTRGLLQSSMMGMVVGQDIAQKL